ncbi:hypothetical protein GYMLUDRAFT_248518 [Collybiopsis luxurians FD-317 M1]|uniref:Unplaced genomic scaffold GYMLUscaffold_56, whole genome shotgun sequence n=1 Tax=Collybiopsis luxurians FD-317 M1 TaxID=944289 RepID=A0A0D0C087_9AGAR|nr:hypothetical protein GYMLUDRAFT_248518 [Collybiopsis luxurians FD-317 M1]
MANLFYNSEYEYAFLESSDYHSSAQSTTYSMLQSDIHADYPQKTSQLDPSVYDHLMNWAQDASVSIPDQQYIPEAEAVQSAQYSNYLDAPANTLPALSSWPTEYFISPSGAEFMPDAFEPLSSSNPSTPELSYTDSSVGSVDVNVFDLQFGDALSSYSRGPSYPNARFFPGDSDSSPSSSCTSSPIPDSFDSFRPRPSRHPSPCSETSSSSLSSDHRRRFPCLIAGCSRRFTSQYTLKVHMEAHKPKPKVYFPCTQGCSERFSRQHDRLRHEVAKHGKVCEFSCDECGRFFSTAKTLGNHKCPVAQKGTRWVHN